MNNSEICQIYHVARCGSTLLTSLISNCGKTYSEPKWAHTLFMSDSCPNEISEHYGSIVKFQSINISIGFKPAGPKVFLYRPLAQYLHKMTGVDSDWIEKRKNLYGQYFTKIQGKELIIEPKTIMQLHSIFWASCVIEMQKLENVLWIKSNDFFLDKEGIAKNVLTHFGKKGEPDMRFANVNVKQLKLNGDGQIRPFDSYITETTEYVTGDHGLIGSSLALENPTILETIEWAKLNMPLDPIFYY